MKIAHILNKFFKKNYDMFLSDGKFHKIEFEIFTNSKLLSMKKSCEKNNHKYIP